MERMIQHGGCRWRVWVTASPEGEGGRIGLDLVFVQEERPNRKVVWPVDDSVIGPLSREALDMDEAVLSAALHAALTAEAAEEANTGSVVDSNS
ncbi:MAG: hypothetical protein WEB88_12610 [Gemmatimonadota bacterium]